MIEQMMFTDALEKLEFARIRVHISSMCVTGFGKEHTERLTPSSMYAFVRDELARVDEMRSMVDVDDRPPFDVLEDMRPALHRAVKEGSVVASSDFLEILHVLVVARNLKTFFSKRAERSPLLAALASELHENKLLEFHIDRVVDDEGNIKDSASRELRIIRRGIIEKSGQLRRRMEAILKRVADEEMVMEDLVTMRDGR
ncbi:MAG: hypothetical protein KFH87_10295, partial [Bacteroidetes bacterium]|nr:hypothetical protein [Bacteroidota bacterium]